MKINNNLPRSIIKAIKSVLLVSDWMNRIRPFLLLRKIGALLNGIWKPRRS